MEAINQPGIKGVCFACTEDAKPKTGRTVVVKSETGDTKAGVGMPDGKVEYDVVDERAVQEKPVRAVTPTLSPAGGITVRLTMDELYSNEIVKVLLTKIYEGLDNMAPPATIKEAKRVFGLQEKIEKLIKSMEK